MKSTILIVLMGTAVFAGTAEQAKLGELLFFDTTLSKNKTQSCSTCHNPQNGFVDNRDNGVRGAVSLGDDGKSLGARNAPTASYAVYSPHFGFDAKKKRFKGGQFLDGRETDLTAQAGGPPMNPIEMGMGSKAEIVNRLKINPLYVSTFEKLYGKGVLDNAEKGYSAMSRAIAAYESTQEFSPFDSKYDRYLRGEYTLTPQEELGKSLFFSNNNTNCATCHQLRGEDREKETFSNYEYHNIGVPSNPLLVERGIVKEGFVDTGLAQNPKSTGKTDEGKFKVPTLRNVAVTGPYMHNGIFKDLRTVVMFYDKYNNPQRTINPETGKAWGDAEIAHSISTKELKAKKLSDTKIDALVAFMKLLTDQKYEHLIH
ncbi:cytochrome c peroxidase [uncultured Sulfuricurvum sp.]|uniref:cytochrome-c peroxidase n=1 Tax=uncultured Sulfuricurvum sp. TaxID=430693 RepID=UPI0026068AF5|nr:cytochrome c peroxidase [uncultured Sulfuricurvum sp.]